MTDYYPMQWAELRDWAATAEAGDYLVKYADTGISDADDPGARCGYDDRTIAQIEAWLRARDLRLVADDVGLVTEALS